MSSWYTVSFFVYVDSLCVFSHNCDDSRYSDPLSSASASVSVEVCFRNRRLQLALVEGSKRLAHSTPNGEATMAAVIKSGCT